MGGPCWPSIAAEIHSGAVSAIEWFYSYFMSSWRPYVARRVNPQDVEDVLHDSFLAVLGAMRAGRIREPDRLSGYIQAAVRSHVIDHCRGRSREVEILPFMSVLTSPEHLEANTAAHQEADALLALVSESDANLLERKYLRQEVINDYPPDQLRVRCWRAARRVRKAAVKARLRPAA